MNRNTVLLLESRQLVHTQGKDNGDTTELGLFVASHEFAWRKPRHGRATTIDCEMDCGDEKEKQTL